MTDAPFIPVMLLRRFAEQAIDGWLTGHTDFDETEFAPYTITRQADGTYAVSYGDSAPQRFHITPIVLPAW